MPYPFVGKGALPRRARPEIGLGGAEGFEVKAVWPVFSGFGFWCFQGGLGVASL